VQFVYNIKIVLDNEKTFQISFLKLFFVFIFFVNSKVFCLAFTLFSLGLLIAKSSRKKISSLEGHLKCKSGIFQLRIICV